MEDRELLELAAKAAGIEGDYSKRANAIVNEDGYWMPLTDDGDAFSLMLKLWISISYGFDEYCCGFHRESMYEPMNPEGARRLIVRVAAEIGKSIT